MLKVLAVVIFASVAHGMQDLVDLAASLNETQLANLIATAGLTDTLKGQGPFTLLAPTDLAFQSVPQENLNKLLGDTNLLGNLLKYHTIQGEIFSWDISSGRIVSSLSGHDIRITKSGNNIYFNNAKAIKVDLEASNGVIYLIDNVLNVPEGTVYQILGKAEYSLSTFKAAVDKIRYDKTLNNSYSGASYRYTVFAPTDAAFAKLDKAQTDRILQSTTYASELVRYHMHRGTLHLKSLDHNGRLVTMYSGHDIGIDISNNDIRLNKVARMIQSDIEADNGVVHVIDHVLIPSTLSGQILG